MKTLTYEQKKKISEGLRRAHAEKRRRGVGWKG